MVELKGTLNGVGLPAVVQLLEELHESGCLVIWNTSWSAELGFDGGQLVHASLGDERGLSALAALPLTLPDGEFAFTPGEPPPERTIQLSPQVVRAHVAELARAAPDDPSQAPAGVACPRLGFADDPDRHYPRPTALHRCYADGSAAVVSGPEQRELCLSGRFGSCPRLRAAQQPAPAPRGFSHVAPPEWRTAGQATTPVAVPTRAFRPNRLRLLTAGLLGVALVLAALGAYRSVFAPAPSSHLAAVAVPTLSIVEPTLVATRPVPVVATATTMPATVVAVPTLAATPTLATLPGPPPLVDARFSDGPRPGWADNPPFAAWSSGAYRMQAAESQHFVAVAAPDDELASLQDVLVTATFRKTGGPPGGGYGLIIRDQGPSPRDGRNQDMTAYVLEVGDLGEYGIWRRDADQWVDLVPWTRDPRVHSGGSPNEMQVLAVGSHITLTVNRLQLAAVDDDALSSGGVGVFTGGDYNEVALDRFVVQVPD